MRKISNSEVSTWLHCKRKYFYEYVLDLEPRVQSGPLTKGNIIHELLEQYYLEKMDDSPEDMCKAAIQTHINKLAIQPGVDILELAKIRDLVLAYTQHYMESDAERYEVIAVETKFAVPMIDDVFALAGTIDAIFLDKEDGTHVAVDHKSSYNFWTDDQAQISGQFVKYVYALRARGFNVKRFMVNQLRTRDLKPGNELFRRAWVRPSDNRIKAVIAQHVTVGSEIMEFRQNPVKETATPIYDKYGCSNCPFLFLCDSDTEGAPVDYLIQAEFQKKQSYGYNREAPE
jgi:CRISPR/Cas system-associated exonuclease Cas4 (RecB family)